MAPPTKAWTQFLESTPPDSPVTILNLNDKRTTSHGVSGRVFYVLPTDDVQLYCGENTCGHDRTFSFACLSKEIPAAGNQFVVFQCRNCRKTLKTFSLKLIPHDDDQTAITATKFGEVPPYGPPVPSRVISLIGPDRETFLKGRRAELHGLGVGAFAYYRRVVEDQTQRLFGELLKAAGHLNDPRSVELLTAAAAETQFSKAVELVKDALPQRLWIRGHNPLTLLHNALSNNLHAGTDESCLELATNIRVVLTELAARIHVVNKEDEGLKKAVAALSNRPQQP